MQVADHPLLLPNDILSLHRDFVLQGQQLHDLSLAAAHQVHGVGTQLVLAIEQTIQYDQLLALCRTHGVTAAQLRGLLGFLYRAGGLQHVRSPAQQVSAMGQWLWALSIGIYYPLPCWRQPASVATLAYGLWRATWPVLCAGALCVMAISRLGVWANMMVYGCGIVGLGTLVASLYVHEYTHLRLLRRSIRAVVLVQRGLRLGLLHPRLGRKQEIVNALAGPVAGMVCCLVIGGAVWLAGLPGVAWWAVGAGIVHGAAWLPGYGDGASLVGRTRSMPS